MTEIERENGWTESLKRFGVLWIHDGNPKRPYALLTNGEISNGFCNFTSVIGTPSVLGYFSSALLTKMMKVLPDSTYPPDDSIVRMVGPGFGAVTMAHELASEFGCLSGFTEKDKRGEIYLKRFDVTGQYIIYVEDVINSGTSTLETINACHKAGGKDFGCILAFVNRTRDLKEICGLPIISLLDIDAVTWERGKNPFTSDGKDVVEPVRPKENWDLLTQNYD
jgi:orotate phosphoribosyltransferase